MNNAESQYFMLMRAALWGNPVEFDTVPDWKGIMHIAKHHATAALVADAASHLEGKVAPSQDVLREMKSVMLNNVVNQMELKQILVSALTALRSDGIEAVLLKGFGLAMLYPNPNLRQFGDIDLFVGLKDFRAACDKLRTLPGSYNWGEEVDVGRHYNIEFGRHPMEVHRVSVDVVDEEEKVEYATIEQDGLMEHPQHVDYEGLELTLPSKEFAVFFTFFHAWHHFLTSGVGWRQMSDVAMTLHAYHGQLDLNKLHRWVSTMHLMQPWQTFGFLMVKHLGLPETEMPFYDPSCRRRAKRLYRRIMETGNFRRNSRFIRNKPRKAGIVRKLHAFFGIFVDFFYLAKVFPAAAWHETRSKWKYVMRKFFKKNEKKLGV